MFADPEKILNQFSLNPGLQVADFGAGSGFYTLIAARAVGEKGRVFAVDLQKDLLIRIKNTATSENLKNIEVVWGDVEKAGGTGLKDASVDRVIISNTFFQIENKDSLVSEANRLLKSNGKAMVVEWSRAPGSQVSSANYMISRAEVSDLFLKAGFELEKEIKAGERHYGLIFTKK